MKYKAVINDIYPCESYVFSVGIVAPIGPGPLNSNPARFNSPYSKTWPPKNLNVAIDGNRHEMTIKWDHSCPLNDMLFGYVVSILFTKYSSHTIAKKQNRITKKQTLILRLSVKKSS